MSDARRTRFNTEVLLRGLGSSTGISAAALNHGQLEELHEVADAAGVKLATTAVVDGTPDVFVIGEVGDGTNFITVRAGRVGPAAAVVTFQIGVAGGDTLAVTNTAGAYLLNLANTTGSNNTLTKVAAAIAAAASASHEVSCVISGTASTQMSHGGTNTVAATAAGGTAAGGLLSSTAGVAQAPAASAGHFTVTPA